MAFRTFILPGFRSFACSLLALSLSMAAPLWCLSQSDENSGCENASEGTTAIVTTFVPTIVVDSIGNTSIVLEEVVSVETCGCTDENATNFYPESTLDNGLCEYGCIDQPEGTMAIVTTFVPYISGDSILIEEVVTIETCGCTDSNATNYFPESTADNGLCEYTNSCENAPEGTAILFTTLIPYLDANGNIVLEEVVSVETCGCTDENATNYYPESTLDNGLCAYASGCTYAIAVNYNPLATTDDGSCLFGGCTDPSAPNYLPSASVDDGSCITEPCEEESTSYFGDLNNDGVVGAGDLLAMLTVFGVAYE